MIFTITCSESDKRILFYAVTKADLESVLPSVALLLWEATHPEESARMISEARARLERAAQSNG